MKLKFIYYSLSFFITPLISLAAPGSVGGNASSPGTVGGNPSNPGSLGGNPPSTSGGSVTLKNPLGDTTLVGFLQDILNVIMVFAVPLIVFMIIYAGFTYVMAQGNEAKVGTAHRTLLYAVIGGVIILGAQIILAVIQGTVDSF